MTQRYGMDTHLEWVLKEYQCLNTDGTYADALYFSVITQSTVGYGHYHPKTNICQTICAIHVCLSVYLNVIHPISNVHKKVNDFHQKIENA